MIKVQWYIDEQTKKLAEIEALNEQVSVSEIFRTALKQYLSKKKQAKKKHNPFSKISGKIVTPEDWKKIKPADLSKNIDKEIYD